MLARHKPEAVLVTGGTAALSAAVENEAATAGGSTVRRLGGATRAETAAIIARESLQVRSAATGIAEPGNVVIADGWNLEDVGIAAALAAALDNTAVLYSHRDQLGDESARVLALLRPSHGYLVGDQHDRSASQRVDRTAVASGIDAAYLALGLTPPVRAEPLEGTYVQVAAGADHSCALRVGGSVRCWGDDTHGQVSPPILGPFTSITAGAAHSCGLRPDGRVLCWGGDAGPFPDDRESLGPFPIGSFFDEQYKSISSNGTTTCAIRRDDTVYCRGNTFVDGNWINPNISAIKDDRWKAVDPGGTHSSGSAYGPGYCGIANDGSVRCWTAEHFSAPLGETGILSTPLTGKYSDIGGNCAVSTGKKIVCWDDGSQRSSPPTGRFESIDAGNSHVCALGIDGIVSCWGDNTFRQADSPDGQFISVSAGANHSCAVRADNTVTCWGANDAGQSDAPDGQFRAVTAGEKHWCAIRGDAQIACWGDNSHGQASPPPGTFAAVDAGSYHTCALRSDRLVMCWGDNEHRQSSAPFGSFSAISVMGYTACGLRIDNTIACWGDNSLGQAVAPEGTFKAVATSGNHSCALRQNDRMLCWGRRYPIPAEPEGFYSVLAIGLGWGNEPFTCALRADNTVACFGYINQVPDRYFDDLISAGEGVYAIEHRFALGAPALPIPLITRFDRSDEAAVGLWKSIGSTDGNYECAIDFDNSIACWGTGFGLGYREDDLPYPRFPSPPDGSFRTIVSSSASRDEARNSFCGVRADNTVTCWGQDRYLRNVAAIDTTAEPMPQSSLLQVASGPQHACALRADQTITCWGDNTKGQLNVPGGRHTRVVAGIDFSCAVRTDETLTCWGGGAEARSGRFSEIFTGFGYVCAVRVDGTMTCWWHHDDSENIPVPDGSWLTGGIGTRSSSGFARICALRSDATIQCWHAGFRPDYRSLINQTKPEGHFTALSVGTGIACALRSDGRIECWGATGAFVPHDSHGRFSPTGQFKAVAAGEDHVCGLRTNGAITCWGPVPRPSGVRYVDDPLSAQ